MGIEIERKFLLTNDTWRQTTRGVYCCQGYLNSDKQRVVRLRIMDEKGFLTVKGSSDNIQRLEFEYEIPLVECRQMLDLLAEKPLIEKIRHYVDYKGFTWEIDEFSGDNNGLVVAEIELASENQPFEKPEWIGKEVTYDPRYFNANLIKHPYTTW